jgi:hypothetical protein
VGNYRVEVTVLAGDGCHRDVADHGTVVGCGRPRCPDCAARRFVRELQGSGHLIENATLTRSTLTNKTVVDDLVSGLRKGSFPAD